MIRSGLFQFLSFLLFSCDPGDREPIDRFSLVNRHRVVIASVDSLNALTLGNGEFAFTADITGLQSFPEYYVKGIPLGTLSNWGWHSYPNREGYSHEQVVKYYSVDGRQVPYYHDFGFEKNSERAMASAYLRQNPHRMNLGMVGFRMTDQEGNQIGADDITNPIQELDLWKGELASYFEVEGIPVRVSTVCHPGDDIIAVKVSSEMLGTGRMALALRFPEADAGWKNLALWGNDDSHSSGILEEDKNRTVLYHQQDSTMYVAGWSYTSGNVTRAGPHSYLLEPGREENAFSFCLEFEEREEDLDREADYETILALAADDWERFWSSGGAVDFSDCLDQRAYELERRAVLSQYLTRIQCSGSMPPQETGLTCNSWFGKMHLEMHWWHSAHFALWQRGEILAGQMGYYRDIRDQARELAAMQGYEGIRWPKMVGPDGTTSPSNVGNYLVWQQPHYIYFAELLYQTGGQNDSILSQYDDLVFETADFMASFPVYDTERNRYILAPPLIPAQETFPAETTLNPAFEICYWDWALGVAIEWKERLGEAVPPAWKEVREGMSDLTVLDSVYLFTENGTDSYTNLRYFSDHPIILGCLGFLPETDKVNRQIMQNTFDRVAEIWNWPHTWGWDYPLVAMAAARLEQPEEAIRFLLLDVQKNTHLPNGHNYQAERLPVYLPGNGGLLTAVARMCLLDQFPKDGMWNVMWENLSDLHPAGTSISTACR